MGGYTAAIRSSQKGAETVLIEKGELGGTCTNHGCIPTKTLLYASNFLSEIGNAADLGIKNVSFELDYAQMLRKKARVVKQIRSGIETLLTKRKIGVIRGEGCFIDQHSV